MPNYFPYMQMMNVPTQFQPMMEMPQDQLESMYPRCYFIINPEVNRHCDMLTAKYGTMFTPTRMMLDAVVDQIDSKVGADVDADYRDSYDDYSYNDEDYDRQFDFDRRRRFRRDLISILLLRELVRRRRPHHFGGFPFRDEDDYNNYPY
jgi:hypothetical protein